MTHRFRSLALFAAVAGMLATFLVASVATAGAAEGFTVIKCKPVPGFKQVDPLLNWGQTSHHVHEFFINDNVTANATVESLRQGKSTCEVPSDKNPFWQPAMRDKAGNLVQAIEMDYRLINQSDPDKAPVVKPPDGLSMISGNTAGYATRKTTGEKKWSCRGSTTPTAHLDLPLTCPAGTKWVELVTYHGFGCWDSSKGPGGGLGRSTGPANSRDQWNINSVTGLDCDAPYTKVPRLSTIMRWPASVAGGYLDSDDKDRDGDPDVVGGSTYHIDWIYLEGKDASGRGFYDRTMALCFNWATLTSPCQVRPIAAVGTTPLPTTSNFKQNQSPGETILAGAS